MTGVQTCALPIWVVLAYKRLNESGVTKWVIEQYLFSEWVTQFEAEQLKTPLPIALNLGGLYEQMLKALLPIEAVSGESIEDQTQRFNHITQILNVIEQLKRKIKNEKQFNRKVEMNRQLKALQLKMSQLT